MQILVAACVAVDVARVAECHGGGTGACLAGAPPTPPNRVRTSCLEQFKSGVFFYVTRIRDRRFVAVDRERGIAFAFAFFDNGSGDARNGTHRI